MEVSVVLFIRYVYFGRDMLYFSVSFLCLQFDHVVLKSALWLLDKAGLSSKAMSNVIWVVRAMTSMVRALFIKGVFNNDIGNDVSLYTLAA